LIKKELKAYERLQANEAKIVLVFRNDFRHLIQSFNLIQKEGTSDNGHEGRKDRREERRKGGKEGKVKGQEIRK